MSTPSVVTRRMPVLAVSSNKGGVGKTTVATNLAIYLRALREDLPVLLVGLDDQHVIDRMIALRPGRCCLLPFRAISMMVSIRRRAKRQQATPSPLVR